MGFKQNETFVLLRFSAVLEQREFAEGRTIGTQHFDIGTVSSVSVASSASYPPLPTLGPPTPPCPRSIHERAASSFGVQQPSLVASGTADWINVGDLAGAVAAPPPEGARGTPVASPRVQQPAARHPPLAGDMVATHAGYILASAYKRVQIYITKRRTSFQNPEKNLKPFFFK